MPPSLFLFSRLDLPQHSPVDCPVVTKRDPNMATTCINKHVKEIHNSIFTNSCNYLKARLGSDRNGPIASCLEALVLKKKSDIIQSKFLPLVRALLDKKQRTVHSVHTFSCVPFIHLMHLALIINSYAWPKNKCTFYTS